jgi:hypothetical protein
MKFKKFDPLRFNQVRYSGKGIFVISKSKKIKKQKYFYTIINPILSSSNSCSEIQWIICYPNSKLNDMPNEADIISLNFSFIFVFFMCYFCFPYADIKKKIKGEEKCIKCFHLCWMVVTRPKFDQLGLTYHD